MYQFRRRGPTLSFHLFFQTPRKYTLLSLPWTYDFCRNLEVGYTGYKGRRRFLVSVLLLFDRSPPTFVVRSNPVPSNFLGVVISGRGLLTEVRRVVVVEYCFGRRGEGSFKSEKICYRLHRICKRRVRKEEEETEE